MLFDLDQVVVQLLPHRLQHPANVSHTAPVSVSFGNGGWSTSQETGLSESEGRRNKNEVNVSSTALQQNSSFLASYVTQSTAP